MAWVAVGVGVGGMALSAFKGAKAKKDSTKLLKTQMEQNDADFNNNANKDFMQTNVAKDAQKQMADNLEESRKNVAGRGVIAGASDEAIVAGNTGANKTFNDGISRLAGAGTQYQNNQDAMHRAGRNALNAQQATIYNQDAENASNLGDNSAGLVAGGINNTMLKKSKVNLGGEQDTSIFKD